MKQTKADDWKEKIKKEVFDEVIYEEEDGDETFDINSALDIAIAKTEEHFKDKYNKLEQDRDIWVKKLYKKEFLEGDDKNRKVLIEERKAFADWLEKKLREHLDGKIAFGVFYYQCHDKIKRVTAGFG